MASIIEVSSKLKSEPALWSRQGPVSGQRHHLFHRECSGVVEIKTRSFSGHGQVVSKKL